MTVSRNSRYCSFERPFKKLHSSVSSTFHADATCIDSRIDWSLYTIAYCTTEEATRRAHTPADGRLRC
jgi:hypothetical protein